MTIKELKAQQKARAATIKINRIAHKKSQSQGTPYIYTPCEFGGDSSRDYRHYHIAYCMARGTGYERIEPKVREGNEPNWKLIDKIRATMIVEPVVEVADAPLCASA